MLFWLSDLGIWATGLFLLALFSPGAGLTLGSSSLCCSSVHGIFKSIQSWPPPEVNATTPCNFRGRSRAKQELGNFMLNPFWKTVGNKNRDFLFLSALTLTLPSLPSPDRGWEAGRTYTRTASEEICFGVKQMQTAAFLSWPICFSPLCVQSVEMLQQRTRHAVISSDWSFGLCEGFRLNQSQLLQRGAGG